MIASLCCAFCSFATGCATTEKITADILGKGRTLSKKIAFLPAVNASGYGGEDLQRAAAEQLRAFLGRRCDNLRIMDSRNILKAVEDMPRLPSGQIDNLALAKLGRIFGLSAVVNQTIGQMECLTETVSYTHLTLPTN